MQAKIPVLAVTDSNTDIGKVIVDGGFGWWCESNNIDAFSEAVQTACVEDREKMGQLAYEYLVNHYSAEKGYDIIIQHFNRKNIMDNF